MQLNLIDILFLITVVLMVLNGLRNGAVFSLINLLSIPIGAAVAYLYGPRFTMLLSANGLPATPLISYGVLFLGTVLILHISGTMVRGIIKAIPIIGLGDSLIGGAVGIAEAWLLWLFLLILLGHFLLTTQNTIQQGSQIVPGLNMQVTQFQNWHDFYNQAVTDSLFAKVNGFFIKALPNMPQPPQ
jgi:uncharacterized membrane protein required for colicin V production